MSPKNFPALSVVEEAVVLAVQGGRSLDVVLF
jgi:hypothetical protein